MLVGEADKTQIHQIISKSYAKKKESNSYSKKKTPKTKKTKSYAVKKVERLGR